MLEFMYPMILLISVIDRNHISILQAKETEIRGTRFVITGLKTGGQYRFRVIAFNAVGNGEPGEVPEVLEVTDRTSELIQTY